MKRRLYLGVGIVTLTLASVTTSHAFIQQIIEEAGWVAVKIDMVLNQVLDYPKRAAKTVQTIEAAAQSLESVNQMMNLKTIYGDAASIVSLDGFNTFKTDLTSMPLVADDLSTLYSSADPHTVLTTDFSNINTIGDQIAIVQPDGSITNEARLSDRYKVPEAMHQQAARLRAIHDQTRDRRITLRDAIASTTEQLKNATTDAEVQKLKSLLSEETSELESIEDDLDVALTETDARKKEIDAYVQGDGKTRTETVSDSQQQGIARAKDNFKISRPSSYPTL